MQIAVTGSLAYDYIMNFPGLFKDHILPEKVHMLTVSFLVDSMKKLRGGTAGNIAYTLALLGAKPKLVATVGTDFGDYRAQLEKAGVDTQGVVEVANEFTASCFINTDKANNQLVAFYAGAMSHANLLSLESLKLTHEDLVLISPTDVASMLRCLDECKRLAVPYVFDPGKQTPRMEPSDILAGIEKAAVLIGNDYEFAMMAQKTGRTEAELTRSAPLVVVTRGDQGSTFYVQGSAEILIPIAPVKDVVDPTGAGDAFLGGLLYAMSKKAPLPLAGRVGALAASYVIEQKGCQEHHYTPQDFQARYETVFGDSASLAPYFR